MVLIRTPGGEWQDSDPADFTNEAELQTLLAESPGLLPGIDEPVVVAAEMAMPGSGRADLVLVGVSGKITIVECKLSTNPEMRRSAVGQLLAYASAVWKLRFEEFRTLFSRAAGADLLAVAGEAASADGLDWDEDDFRRSVDANLASGDLTLIMAVDEITEEMKKTILYLNHRMAGTATVLAMEAGVVRTGELEILIPKTYGEESAAEQRAPAAARAQWDEASLFAKIEAVCSAEAAASIRELYDAELEHSFNQYFGTGQSPSVTFWYRFGEIESAVWSIYSADRGATFDLNFDWIRARGVAPERMGAFAEAMAELPGFAAKLTGVAEAEFRKRPSFNVEEVLAGNGAVEAIGARLRRFVGG